MSDIKSVNKRKVKQSPYWPITGLEVSRRLRLPDF
jgi:hypothetical protein